jgi:hypothetical protein
MWERTPELVDKICDALAEGQSLIKICSTKGMPSRSTVLKWMREDKEFCASIAHAREDQADYYLDKQIEYAENATIEDYQLRKFQADNLKWVASKLKPKKYGDKQFIDMELKDSLTKEQRDAALAAGIKAES